MPSIFESVTELLNEESTLDEIGSLLGGNKKQAKKAIAGSTPSLVAGLADKAAQPGGSETIVGLLDSAQAPDADTISEFITEGKPDQGNDIIDGIFGSNRDDLIETISSKNDLEPKMVGKLLPMLAPIVMGFLAKTHKKEKLDNDGVASLLGDEKAALVKDGLVASKKKTAKKSEKKKPVAAEKASKKADTAKKGAKAGVAGAAASASAAKSKSYKSASAAKNKAKTAKVSSGAAASKARGVAQEEASRGWFWWLLAAIAGVLAIAFLLKQCGSDEETPNDETTIASTSVVDGEKLATEAEASMADTDGLKGYALNAIANTDGVVTLQGKVPTEELRAAAAAAVEGNEGVTSVVNSIEVDETVEPTETTVAGETTVDAPSTTVEAPTTTAAPATTAASTTATPPTTAKADSGSAGSLNLEPIEFEEFSSQLTADGQATLDKAAEFIKANEGSYEIQGHTNDVGPADGNQRLSQKRADRAKQYLVSKGIAADSLTAKGFGESTPKVPHGSAGALEANRRVVIVSA